MATSPVQLPTTRPAALPVVGGELAERADAARNRLLILAAAARLVEERGAENVSMEAIATAAGVGKGTLFRRFGDRVGLMHALLDERERELQDELIRGEPPLGPGAPAVERLVAFGRRMVEHVDLNGELLLEAERGPRWVRFNAPVYAFYRAHVRTLVREAAPAADADYLAEALLAPLAADFHLFLRRGRELSLDRVAGGYEDLVRRLLGAASSSA